MFSNPATERRPLLHQIPSMPSKQPQPSRYVIEFLFEQAKARHRGAEHGVQVVGVGLVARIGRLTELLRGKGMHNPRFEAGRSERPFDGKMIVATALHRGDLVSDAILAEHLPELEDCQLEAASRVEDLGGLDEHLSVEIAEHPLRLCLAHIDTDNPEAFRADFLHPWVRDAVGLLDASTTGSTTLGTGLC